MLSLQGQMTMEHFPKIKSPIKEGNVLFSYSLLLLSFSQSLSLIPLSFHSLALSLPPFFSPSPSPSLLSLPSPLHHTQKPLFKGAFFQLSEVKSLPLCGEGSLTFPQQHLFKDFTFVTLWGGQEATVER